MDEMKNHFKNLEKSGKNDVDNLITWMKNAKIIESTQEAENDARKVFAQANQSGKVTLNQFEKVLAKVAIDGNKTLSALKKQLGKSEMNDRMQNLLGKLGSNVDEMKNDFKDLEKSGKNDVNSLITWMKDAKIIENTREAENNARKIFAEAHQSGKVTLDEFQKVLAKVALDGDKTLSALKKQLGKSEMNDRMENLLGKLGSNVNEMKNDFKDLEKSGKNDVDSLITWMKDAKIIENTQEAENNARKIFAEAHQSGKVTLDDFQKILAKVALDGNKTLSALKKQLEKSEMHEHMQNLFSKLDK